MSRALSKKMYKYLFIIFFIVPVNAFSEDWRHFSLEPDPWFSIQTTGKGRISVGNHSVTIKIETAQIMGTNKIKGENTLMNVKVGIAHYVNNEDWLVSSLSPPQNINATINKETILTIAPFKTTFDVPSKILENKHWVVLRIELMNEEGKTVYGFTHEPD